MWKTTSYTYDGLDRQRAITVDDPTPSGDLPGDVDESGTTKNVYDGLSATVVGQYDAVNGALSKPEVL
ncbi:hypothetical protein [Nocardioides humi]|uniref:YD repeat-containing protein n=1 Tax=Nocardioides humi TaxID=449461 RepID=A0ABN2A3U0_9ACTN|nr:hypothetical protein [Nocardioides humi]